MSDKHSRGKSQPTKSSKVGHYEPADKNELSRRDLSARLDEEENVDNKIKGKKLTPRDLNPS